MGKRQQEHFETWSSKKTKQDTAVGNAISASRGSNSFRRTKKSSKLANFVKAIVRGDAEKKEALTGVNSTLNATQSAISLVSGIAQGTTGITRVGLEVTHAYVEVALVITNATAAGASGDAGFWALILDRQPNGALPTFAQIFDDSVGGQAGNDFRITTTNQDRFKVLSRNEWAVGASGTSLATPPYHVKEYINLSNLKGADAKANFSGAGATIASIDSGSIYFVVASALSTAAFVTTVVGQVKYRFSDI